MDLYNKGAKLEDILQENLPIEAKVNVLFDVLKNVLDEGAIRARTIRFKLQKYVNSSNINERIYALDVIASDGNGAKVVPADDELEKALEDVLYWISENIAKKYVQNKIEADVEKALVERQDKFMDELRVSIIKKQKGKENTKTTAKLERLEKLDAKHINKNVMSLLRPENFNEIVGQERAIRSLISKMYSPYPQHIILYGPPGVGKTSAARLALEAAKKLKFTPFDEDSRFVEVDGTTLRWDPREITNPLLGSVHDYYDPDDENIPEYIRYLFEKGAPADFVLIGATTKDPSQINPALRSRCTEVYFEPLSSNDIKGIVDNASEKLHVGLEDGVGELISQYTIEGRKAVNILADAYGYSLFNKDGDETNNEITLKDVEEVISIGRYLPFERIDSLDKYEVGHVYGLGVSGFLGSTIEIESTVFKAKKKGHGTIKFNDTAGSMAKDSVFNAASVIRKITDIDINDYDIHVNVIGGGKIDGPSAGAAITICIISALTERPIRQDVAITGEISLRGNIKPVGGIFEKIYGARRKGIKLVAIPKDNEKEVPLGLEDIEVKSISHIEELMEIVFEK